MSKVFAFLYDTLIASNAWLNIAAGLWMTLRITLVSLLLGSLLSLPLCALRMSRVKVLSLPAKAYIGLVRGTPVLMLLMLLYYVVFAALRPDASLVAILAFSLNLAVSIAEIIRGALESIPKGQLEAARALRMGSLSIFVHITLPQAIRAGLPAYQTTAVNLLQWTSVVGYVSITDLTRAINFIGTRTMQPLLMLAVGIVLYLLMARLITAACAALGRRQFGYSRRWNRRKTA